LLRWWLISLATAICVGWSGFYPASGFAQADPNAASASPIIGFQRIELPEGWHLVGPPLEPFAAATGQVRLIQNNQVFIVREAESPQWSNNQWRGYELRLASGRRGEILASGRDWVQVNGNLAADGLTVGEAVSVLPTLEEYLGGQLTGGETVAAADWVATYQNGELVRLHRNLVGQWLDGADRPVRLSVACGEGFFLNLVQINNRPRSIVLVGQWEGDQGGGFIANGQQVVSFPLSATPKSMDSMVWLAAQGRGAVAGLRPESSDRLSILDELRGGFRTCWLDASTGQWLWQDTGERAGGLVLEAGRGYLYHHLGPGFYLRWR
jgi:hypothetical protein